MQGADTRAIADPKSALVRLLSNLTATEGAAPECLQNLQDSRLRALSTHHTQHTPAYRARLERANIRELDLSSLKSLPPIRRRDIQDEGAAFTSAQIPEQYKPLGKIKTSGSTGEPVELTKTAVNQLFWSAYTIRDHVWNHRNFMNRMTAIRANISTYLEGTSWGFPASQLFATGPAQGIPISTPVERQAELIDQFQPDILIVYPGNLAALLEIWNMRKRTPPPKFRHVKTIGETVSPELRRRTRETFGLAIEDNYSSQEAGPIAIQCPEGGLYHIMGEALIVEVLDENDAPCKAGKTGRVVITDLHNFAAPLIRYDIGDIAEAGPACSCGKTLPTLKRVLGRERNLVQHRNGDRHWPLVGFHRFAEVAAVQQYQFIQHSLDEIEIRIVTRQTLTPAQEIALIDICSSALGKDFSYRLSRFREWLPKAANGKFEEFICRIDQPAARNSSTAAL